MTDVLKVDVWSDVACPWCYIGKRRFAEGVRRYTEAGGDRVVEVEYHSFELSPDTPVDFEGDEIDFLAKHKRMPVEQVRQLIEHVKQVATGEGLDYDFEALHHTKTLKAHELLHLAKAHGKQEEMKERLLAAYFVEGRHVGRIEELTSLAADVGLDPAEVTTALETGTYSSAVAADIAQGLAYGINGVPVLRDRRPVRRERRAEPRDVRRGPLHRRRRNDQPDAVHHAAGRGRCGLRGRRVRRACALRPLREADATVED